MVRRDTYRVKEKATGKYFSAYPQLINISVEDPSRYCLRIIIGINGYSEWTTIECIYDVNEFNDRFEVLKYEKYEDDKLMTANTDKAKQVLSDVRRYLICNEDDDNPQFINNHSYRTISKAITTLLDQLSQLSCEEYRQDLINAIENTDVKLSCKDWNELMNAINSVQIYSKSEDD